MFFFFFRVNITIYEGLTLEEGIEFLTCTIAKIAYRKLSLHFRYSQLVSCDIKNACSSQSRDDNGINFDMPANELLKTKMLLLLMIMMIHDDDDTDCVETYQKISVSQANESVKVLRQFALQTGTHEILDYVFKVEESLADVALSKTKQPSICDCFKRCDD